LVNYDFELVRKREEYKLGQALTPLRCRGASITRLTTNGRVANYQPQAYLCGILLEGTMARMKHLDGRERAVELLCPNQLARLDDRMLLEASP
jgi:hypothetical protein